MSMFTTIPGNYGDANREVISNTRVQVLAAGAWQEREFCEAKADIEEAASWQIVADIDEAATFIPTATAPPVEFPDKPMTGPSLMAPKPFEISCPGGGTVLWIDDELFIARQITIDNKNFIQGCWLDWTKIRMHLARLVSDANAV